MHSTLGRVNDVTAIEGPTGKYELILGVGLNGTTQSEIDSQLEA